MTQNYAYYHPEYGRPPLDCVCVMIEKVYCKNAMCRFFRENVPQNDSERNTSIRILQEILSTLSVT